ncbi:M56 family metallopeptidase [Gillisia hiemivivida]|uniref:TonB-dependent receptor plug domain-containing protein n=1 Tax=Gillisia hiemivivida TaxID=291190 RepID=A0A5C6ZQI9_9FLAO|nr:M56 family metallopeptidase [Gillisia hiemivivida]TXD92531.1 hypothetical protein ES724_13665 [Gillisia hiemivivida]
MESLLIYLLKSAGLLSIFYVVYILLLKNDTSFTANRKFLIGGILASLILPAVYFTKMVLINAPNIAYTEGVILSELNTIPETAIETNWWQIFGLIYLLISAIFLIQLAFRVALLVKMINKNKSIKQGKYTVIETSNISGPFSFFNYIFINPKDINEDDLQLMLTHEKVHASQCHSVDILLSHLITVVLWFNPISWFYKKIIEQNLEFIADHETAQASECIQHYQHVLVKVSTNNNQPALVNHFYQSFIKKRILMLNKKNSSSRNAWKYQLILPLIAIFIMSFNVKTTTKYIESNYSKITEPIVQQESLSVTVVNTATNESLEKFKSIFLKWDVELYFNNIEYSSNGKTITAIEVKFKNLNTGETGVLNRNDSNGIEPFEIYVIKNGKTGFRDISPEENIHKNDTSLLKEIGENPIYIINNKEYSTSDLDGKTIATKNRIDVLKRKDALKKFGSKASDGVIIVAEGKIIDDFKEELERIDKENPEVEMNFIEIKENSKPVLIHLRASKSKSSKKVGEAGKPWKIGSKVSVASVEFETNTPSENSEQITAAKAQGNPLIFIDGKMQKVSINIKDIDPNEIARISLVSGEDPVKIYGKKAKDGLVLITSKKAGNKMSRYVAGQGVQVYNMDKFSKNDNSKWAERAIGKRDYYPIGNISSSTTIINRKDSIVNTRTSNGNKITIISNDSVSNRKNYKMVKLDSVININASNIPNSKSFYIRSGDKRPLIIIDGIIKEESFDLDEISASAIESMNVLKDQSAIKKYGKKAENGVIEVILKEKK